MPNIFDIELVFKLIPKLLKYLPVTIELTLFSMLAGLLLGLLLALIKIKKIPVLYQISVVFISFIRGTPILVQLYLSYAGIPLLLKYYNYYHETTYNVNSIPSLFYVLLALSLNEAAYNSELIRAALLSVDKGQTEAAQSLGMTYGQVLRRIIIPEAFIVALPTLGNALIGLMKGTSLAFVASVVEITAQSRILAGNNLRFFESYCALALIYWAMTILIEQVVAFMERRLNIDFKSLRKRKGELLLD
ncbi:amino acid ABC transporter permease [Paenibacillus sp. HN-1]|uniref:amino acid ABC transporter permease n=1 Tax=Paenibacillus TaxID=44249 RepID=UPI001CA8EF73|nr:MULTISPECIES: amino acid ABC transporter permease [Paenibacillus]MBY9081436.1 amino acid ABC transporter permease [Paenibacillus sp. CGMCC 1.18879]MBY9084956.1 amino acid ABC transporter permease [Paenibacillus sinensis]